MKQKRKKIKRNPIQQSKKSDAGIVTAHLDLFSHIPVKIQNRMLQIVESAIECYVELGVEQTTFDAIAKKCGITRPLITYYFSDRREIFLLTFKYIRSVAQKVAVEGMKGADTPERQLECYLRWFFAWAQKYPTHGKVWLLFYYYCGVDENLKHLNKEIVQMGRERIAAILKAGLNSGVFSCSDPNATAKHIQHFITGALVAAATEGFVSMNEVADDIVAVCGKLAKGR